LKAAIAAFWAKRSARERTVLLAAAVLVLAAMLYSLLWEPGQAARKSLSATLPRLRAQVEDMRRQQKEILQLRKKLGAESSRGDLKALLQASVARTSFAKAVERSESLSGNKVLVQAGPPPFDAWLEWIEVLQRELGVRVDTCRITALDKPGLVRVEVTFVAGTGAAAGKPQ